MVVPYLALGLLDHDKRHRLGLDRQPCCTHRFPQLPLLIQAAVQHIFMPSVVAGAGRRAALGASGAKDTC